MPSAIFTLCCSFKEFMQWCSHDLQLYPWYLLRYFPTICTHVLQNSNVSQDASMDLGHGLDWMRLNFHVDYLLRLKWMFWGWHSSHCKVSAQLASTRMLTHTWCMLAFYGKKVSSEAEAVSQELEAVSDPGVITKGIDVLLGFLLKCAAPPSCLFPSSQLMVNSVMNGVNALRLFQCTVSQVVLGPDIPHEDTALFPGQRCEMLWPIFLKSKLERKWEGPS